MTDIRIVAFGDIETGTWGFGWLAGPSAPAQLALAAGSAREFVQATLESGGPEDGWRLDGDGVSLEVIPTGPPAAGGTADEVQTLDQVCTIAGRIATPDGPVEVESLGWRSTASGQAELKKVESFRWLAGWLGPQQGFSLLALRPRKARGHEDDVIAAALIDDPPAPRIDDPRLSTTYDEAGLPARVGLELWLDAESNAVQDGDTPPQYPRRAAGQVVSQGPAWSGDGVELRGWLVCWRSRGHQGAGVYVLGQRR